MGGSRPSYLFGPAIALAVLCGHVPLGSIAQCGPGVPSFSVDLGHAPDATYLSPSIQRQGQCCGASAPDQCLEFVIDLHPDAQGIDFAICEGAVPPGALFYQIGCGPPVQVGQSICLYGPGPHLLTFCKPGNNTNRYCITSIPTPSAGPGIVLNEGCTGTITSNGFAPGTILWTSIAPGTPGAYDDLLSCPSCPNTSVTGRSDTPAHVDYQVCGNAIAPCSSDRYCDTVRVFFNPTLTVVIEPLAPTVCFGAAGTTITAMGGGGTPPYSFLWNTGATEASIFVAAGTYEVLMSDASDCPPTIATVVVTAFAQSIRAIPGDDILVCGQETGISLNGSVTGASGGTWSGGDGIFLPSRESLNATYTPTSNEVSSGSVQLTLHTTGNGTCPGDQGTLTITFADPFIDVGITATDATCHGSTDGTAAISPQTAGWSHSWVHDALLTGPQATGLSAGTYTITITDVSGCDTTLSAVVDAPAAITIAEMTVLPESCAGMNDGEATATVQGGTPPYTYLWNNGADTPGIVVNAGTWTVMVGDAHGCGPVEGTAVVEALGQPNIAHAGPGLIGCLDNLPIDLNGTVTNATGAVWSGGNGTFLGSWPDARYQPTANEVLAGGVDLVLTTTGNGNCPPGTDTLSIRLSNTFLNAFVSGEDVLCHGGATGSARFEPHAPGAAYAWNDPSGQTTSTANGLSQGIYQVHVTDALGCDTVMSVTISEPPPLSATLAGPTPPTCHGGTNGSVMVSATGGTMPYSHSWGGTATGQSGGTANALASGPFTVTVTDGNGCTVLLNGSLDEPPPILLTATVPDTVCLNTPVELTAFASGGSGPYHYDWGVVGNGDTLLHAFDMSQTVFLEVTDAAGCHGPQRSFDVLVLDLSKAILTTLGDTTVCPGDQAIVSAAVHGYPGEYTTTWPGLGTTGNGPFTVPVLDNDTVLVTVTDGCGQQIDGTIILLVEHPPVLDLPEIIAEGCAPLHVTMPAIEHPVPLTYAWNLGNGMTSGSSTPSITYSAGQYEVSLVVSTPQGCKAAADTPGLVIAHPPPVAAFTADPWTTDIDNPSISFTDMSNGDIIAYFWDLGDGATSTVRHPAHTYDDIGDFQVELQVADRNGCTDLVTRTVHITPVYDITIPNVFTPSTEGSPGGYWIPGDLSNDVFYPFTRFVKDYRMRVFNRWGELIFESNDLAIGWDGWYRGRISPQDVYVYQVWVRFVDDKEVLRMGDVTLLR